MSRAAAITGALRQKGDAVPGIKNSFVEGERPLYPDAMPALVARFLSAGADRQGASVVWTGKFSLAIYCEAAAPEQPAADAAALAEQLLAALYADMTLGGLVPGEIAINSMDAEFDSEGEFVARKITLEIEAAWVDEIIPAISGLDDFLHAHVEIDMASPQPFPAPPAPDGQVDAHDDIFLRR